MKAVRISLALVVVLGIIVVECATLFIIFVPVVPETASEYTCLYGYTCPKALNYYGSISFYYFGVGMAFQGCSGFQMVTSSGRSPTLCYSGVRLPNPN